MFLNNINSLVLLNLRFNLCTCKFIQLRYMISYLTFVIIGRLPVFGFLGIKPQEAFLFFAIVLLIVFFVGIYLITNHYKKEFDFKRHDLTVLVNTLKLQEENLRNELAKLKEKLVNDEKERGEWQAEREKLLQEIKDLKEQILEITQKAKDDNNDIIIEYYMNDNESE